jgi:hypothetical protein
MRLIWVVWAVALIACGCGKAHDTRPWPPSEEHPKGDNFFYSQEARRLADDEFRVVSRNEAEAFARLEGAPAVGLTAEEATRFVDTLPGGTAGQLVLLRAVAIHDRLTEFEVQWREDSVKVSHRGTLRGRAILIRRAVIARLPAIPKYTHMMVGVVDTK